jgi:hypothetical protein
MTGVHHRRQTVCAIKPRRRCASQPLCDKGRLNNMKSIYAVAIVAFLLLTTVCARADELSTEFFSIEIPKGMKIDEQKVDSISLIFSEDNDLQKGTLSVSVRPGTDQWQKIKPTITAGKSLLFEKTEETPTINWRTIGVRGNVGQFESDSVVYYGVYKEVTYMLHYHCQQGRCTEIATEFHNVFSSFKPK